MSVWLAFLQYRSYELAHIALERSPLASFITTFSLYLQNLGSKYQVFSHSSGKTYILISYPLIIVFMFDPYFNDWNK